MMASHYARNPDQKQKLFEFLKVRLKPLKPYPDLIISVIADSMELLTIPESRVIYRNGEEIRYLLIVFRGQLQEIDDQGNSTSWVPFSFLKTDWLETKEARSNSTLMSGDSEAVIIKVSLERVKNHMDVNYWLTLKDKLMLSMGEIHENLDKEPLFQNVSNSSTMKLFHSMIIIFRDVDESRPKSELRHC